MLQRSAYPVAVMLGLVFATQADAQPLQGQVDTLSFRKLLDQAILQADVQPLQGRGFYSPSPGSGMDVYRWRRCPYCDREDCDRRCLRYLQRPYVPARYFWSYDQNKASRSRGWTEWQTLSVKVPRSSAARGSVSIQNFFAVLGAGAAAAACRILGCLFRWPRDS